jgi:hypothetical protein
MDVVGSQRQNGKDGDQEWIEGSSLEHKI